MTEKAAKTGYAEGRGGSALIFDKSDGQDLRINTIGSYLKRSFGRKIVKLAIDGGFTCPNRDGSKGHGGCLFCSASGSGDTASGSGNIRADIDSQIALLSEKWPDAGYIAYFQSHTNTYAPVDELRAKFREALSHPGIIGLAVSTRPDCLPDDVTELLSEIDRKTFLWVELGLQSIHKKTMSDMNLCYTLEDHDMAVEKLRRAGIRTVTHLILGLPGEDENMMFDSVRYVCEKDIFGIKLHMLNLVKGSAMEKLYPGYVSFDSIDEYADLVIRLLEIIPPGMTVHRISADAPRSILIAPEWSYRKRTILNTIHNTMRSRDTWQGRLSADHLSGPSLPSL